MQPNINVTRYLKDWEGGSQQALSALVDAAYDQLSVQARNMMRQERRGHTLQTRALVHETYIRLKELQSISWDGKKHFYSMASSIMRRILVDHARSKAAVKRGSNAVQVTLNDVPCSTSDNVDAIALDSALSQLALYDQTQATIVELRYFGGLGNAEIAEQLGMSPATVKRKWVLARAFLYRELSDGDDDREI